MTHTENSEENANGPFSAGAASEGMERGRFKAGKVLIAGAGGFVGKALAEEFSRSGWQVSALSRDLNAGGIFWDPEKQTADLSKMEGFDAFVCLSGESIFGRWTKAKKDAILSSRLKSAGLLVGCIRKLQKPPRVFLCASAVGFYGNNPSCDEASPKGEGFLSDVCDKWERAAQNASGQKTRVVNARFGIVLDRSGGFWTEAAKGCVFGFPIVAGSPSRNVSWISLQDLARAAVFACVTPSLSGPVNFCAPSVATAAELAKKVAPNGGRNGIIPLPAFLFRLVFGEMADDLLLSDCAAFPEKLAKANFHFKHPGLKFL